MKPSEPKDAITAAVSAGRVPLGMQCFSGSPALIEIIGHTGFDFVMLDTEHACIDSAQVEQLIRVAENVALLPLVRVAENSSTPIRKALEAGAAGVVVPRVRGPEDVKMAVDAARYPPHGSRGMCPSTRAARYSISGWDEYVLRTNRDILVIPLLEHPDAIESAEEICELDEVRIVFFGPGDLGMAMGVGASGLQSPQVEEAFDHVLAVANRTGTLVMGVPYPDLSATACQSLIERGVRVLLHSVDELLFYQLCQRIVSELKPIAQVR